LNGHVAAAALSLSLAACAARPTIPQAPPRPDSAARFVADAIAMLGQPYRYGGDAPGGFDCSGLVFYAARGAGLELPRTAEDQSIVGEPVARGRIRAGDLVFMHFARKELHVGIAIDGKHFVHAPSSHGRVRIDSLESPPYARAFVRARRPRFPP